MDFGPVVKPLGITVKKDVGKVLETSEVVRPQATREFRKVGQEPRSPKRSRKRGGPKKFEFQNFEIQNFEIFKSFVAWCLRRCWFYCIFWRQNVRAERSVKCIFDKSNSLLLFKDLCIIRLKQEVIFLAHVITH